MKIFVVDVGNSNSVFGLFEGTRLRWQRRCETAKTVSLVKKIGLKRVDGVAVASVVPSLDRTLKQILAKKFGVTPLFVSSRITLPIKLKVRKPSQVGADRIANVVGAWMRFQKACIVVDFGTATTFDVISAKGEYLGGPIAPGIGIANAALHEKTAKLPLVPIMPPRRVIGKETRECIQSGVLYGYAGLVEGLIARIKKEYGRPMRVIATGGLAPLILPHCCSIKATDPFLTLEGLKIIYKLHA